MATQFDKVKLYLFPGLVSVLGLIIWSIVSEIRSDMKFLMSQYSADHVRIDNLERVVYGKSLAVENNKSSKEPIPPYKEQTVAIIPDNRNLKHLAKKKAL
jgi:hypothetical protein